VHRGFYLQKPYCTCAYLGHCNPLLVKQNARWHGNYKCIKPGHTCVDSRNANALEALEAKKPAVPTDPILCLAGQFEPGSFGWSGLLAVVVPGWPPCGPRSCGVAGLTKHLSPGHLFGSPAEPLSLAFCFGP